MSGWSPQNLISQDFTITANLAAAPLVSNFNLSCGGATKGLVVGVKASGVAGTVSIQLQTAMGMNEDFTTVTGKTVAVANGWSYIKLHENATGDAALLPLLSVGRLVITSNGTGAGTISAVKLLQER